MTTPSSSITLGFRLVDVTVTYDDDVVIIDSGGTHVEVSGMQQYVFTDGTVNVNDDRGTQSQRAVRQQRVSRGLYRRGGGACQPLVCTTTCRFASKAATRRLASTPRRISPPIRMSQRRGVNPLAHFLQLGILEGRSPFADGVFG